MHRRLNNTTATAKEAVNQPHIQITNRRKFLFLEPRNAYDALAR